MQQKKQESKYCLGTTHSISRKGVRRGDMSDEELKQILCQLLPLVRTDFVIPPYHLAVMSAVDRGKNIMMDVSSSDLWTKW